VLSNKTENSRAVSFAEQSESPKDEKEGSVSDDQLIKLEYGPVRWPSGSLHRSRISSLPFTDVIWRLREAIQEAELCVLHEIDSKLLMRRGGYLVNAARQVYFFHPTRMERILRANPAALHEAPLKIAVLELPDGTVSLLWNEPAEAFARYRNSQLKKLGIELSIACDAITMACL